MMMIESHSWKHNSPKKLVIYFVRDMNVNQTVREAYRANLIILILKNKVIIGFNKQGRTWGEFKSFRV